MEMESASRESRKDEVAGTPASKEHSREDDQGTREPYNCAFCRRGFPTAQALGGHMNVHRKHRGRESAAAEPSTAAAAAAVQGRISCCYDDEQQYCSLVTAAFAQTHASCEMPSSMATTGERLSFFHAVEPVVAEPKELRLFVGRDDRGKGAQDDDVQEDRYHSKDDGDQGEGEDLDLELRLGGAGSS